MTIQVATVCESSGGLPCHQRNPLYSIAAGARMHVIRSNFPVLMSVATDVNTKKKSEPRKKRSAGSGGVLAGSVVAAMAVNFQGSTAGAPWIIRAAQTITLLAGLRRLPRCWPALRGRFCASDWKSPATRVPIVQRGKQLLHPTGAEADPPALGKRES